MRQRWGHDLSLAEKKPGKACFDWFPCGRFRPDAACQAIFVLKALIDGMRVTAVVSQAQTTLHLDA
jgi:hypothetical protein